MTAEQALTILKLRLDIKTVAPDGDNDALLSSLLGAARGQILAYTKRKPDKWLGAFDPVMITLASSAFARLGMDGVASRTEGDISTAFDVEADAKTLSMLASYRLVGV